MKRLLIVLTVLLAFLLVGCEIEETRTPEQWAVHGFWKENQGRELVLSVDEYDYSLVDGAIFKGTVFGTDEDLYFACFRITATEPDDDEPTERIYFVVVAFECRWSALDVALDSDILAKRIPYSAVRDVDIIEVEAHE